MGVPCKFCDEDATVGCRDGLCEVCRGIAGNQRVAMYQGIGMVVGIVFWVLIGVWCVAWYKGW